MPKSITILIARYDGKSKFMSRIAIDEGFFFDGGGGSCWLRY